MSVNNLDNILWTEKYRPKNLAELIVPQRIKRIFEGGVVQSMLTPAKDKLTGNTLLSGLSAIPGIGNAVNSAGEILLSCGMLIKNSVGVIALIAMVIIAIIKKRMYNVVIHINSGGK